MSHLLREHAPITEESWARIDEEARERLTPALAARKLVDFAGPLGWQHSATNLGRVATVKAPFTGVSAGQRRVLPLVEARANFSVTRAELADSDRGAEDTDFADLDRAAHDLAVGGERRGLPRLEGGGHRRHRRGRAVCADRARQRLRALPAACRDGDRAAARGRDRRPLRPRARAQGARARAREQRARRLSSCSTISARSSAARSCGRPGVEGAVVVSLRGGDFLFESGEDISVGYIAHDAEAVQLYLEESFSFRVATPEAAVRADSLGHGGRIPARSQMRGCSGTSRTSTPGFDTRAATKRSPASSPR